MPVIIDTGVDNAGLRAGLLQTESMVDASVKRIAVKMNAAGKITGASMVFAPAALEKNIGLLGLAATRMQQLQTVGSGLNSVMGRMTGIFSSGLGISAAIGGLALLGTAFSKAIKFAEQFQTAQISIGAILLSTYKVKTPGGQEAGGTQGYMYAHEQSLKYNKQIIERSRINILTYEEQLKAFQVGLAAGGRKGIQPEKVMDISEQIAVGAKAIGLRGERIGEQVRILLGGGVNVQRSMFAKILGITSKDISSRSGDELVTFIKSRMKGFETKGVKDEFENSIEAIITTMTSQIDVFLATVGTKVMKKIKPTLQGFGEFLQGPDAAKIGDMLVTGFTNVFTAIEKIAQSPAIPLIGKFVTFLANEADKIIIGAVLLRLVGVLTSIGVGVAGAIGWFNKLGLSAAVAAKEVHGLAAANAEVGMTGGGRMGGFGTAGARVAGAGSALLSPAQLAGITALQGRGTLQAQTQARNLAAGMYARRVALGQAAAGQKTELAALLAGGGAAAGGGGLLGRTKGWFAGGAQSRAAGFAGKLGKGALAGGLTYGGIKLGADMAGMGDYSKPSGVATDTAARGLGGAVAGFSVGGPWGAAIGGVAGLGSELVTLALQTKAANTQVAGMTKTMADFNKAHPEAAKVIELNKDLARAKRMARIPALEVEGRTTKEWGAEAGRIQTEIDATKKRAADKFAAKQKKDWESDPANKGLHFTTDTERGDLAKLIGVAQSTAKQVAEGTGPLRQKQAAYWTFADKALNLRKSIQDNDVKLVDADLIAKNAEIEKRLAMFDKMDSSKFTPAQKKQMATLGEQQQDLSRRQGERYITEARGGMTAAQQDIDRRHKEAMEEGGIDTLQTQYRKGRRAVESQARTDKDILGGDYTSVLKKRLADFDTVFDMRGKKIAQQLAGLGLGVGSENVVQTTKLAFDKAMADIDQALATHVITQAEALKLRAQQKQKNVADQIINAYEQSRHLGLVATAKSEVAQKQAAEKAKMAGASGYKPLTEAAYKGIEAIESERSKMKAADFARYKADATDKLRRDTRQHAEDIRNEAETKVIEQRQMGLEMAKTKETQPLQRAQANLAVRQASVEQARTKEEQPLQLAQANLNVGSAKLGAAGARQQSAEFEANLNPANASVMDRAKRIVGREQPRIGLDEAIGLVREGISLQRRANAAAIQKADLDVQMAAIEAAFLPTMQDLTNATQAVGLGMTEIEARYLPALQETANDLQSISWRALGEAVTKATEALANLPSDAIGAENAIAEANTGPATGNKPSSKATNGPMNVVNVDVAPTASFTEKDVDAWMPRIREKLCKLAANSGSRG